MPLKLSSDQTDDFFVVAEDAHGIEGANVPAGSVVTVTSADPNSVVITQDATPRNAPDGSVSIASGKVAPAATVAQPNVAINVTSHIANADGSASSIPDAVDTVTIVPGVAVKEGVLFGTPTP